MIVVITISILATILVSFGRFNNPDKWLKIGFILVTFLGAIHYNYGNDYKSYFWAWNAISFDSIYDVLSPKQILYEGARFESGWVILNAIFNFDDGFYYMVAFINAIEGVIYYRFIKRFVPKQMYILGFFLYVFTSELYLLNFSMMRQGLAIALILLSFIYFSNKELTKMILTLVVAVSIHTSAIMVAPFFILCNFVKKMKASFIAIMLVFTFGFIYTASSYTEDIFNIIISMEVFEDYKWFYYGDKAKESYGLGFVLLLVPYITMMCFMMFKSRSITKEEKCLIVLSFVTLLLKPFEVVGAHLVARVGFYFSAFKIAIIPIMYEKINNPIIKIICYGAIITFTVYNYIMFYDSPTYKDAFEEFHSIFDL